MGNGPYSFAQRSRTLQNGLTDSDFAGKPAIAIVNTWSDMNTPHGHLRDVAQVVKPGEWETGGYPVELPAMSLGEIMMKPTAMLYRNLLSLDLRRILTTTAPTVAVPETPSTPIFAADLARPPLPEHRSICYQAASRLKLLTDV